MVLRKVIVASVGFNWRRVLRGLYGIGFNPGDAVILVNSYPKRGEAEEAMNILKSRFEELGLNVAELWLNPENPFEYSVAQIRSLVEGYAPCSTVFLVSGGFRWLAMALIMAAIALKTIGEILGDKGVTIEKIRVELEEEAESVSGIELVTPYIEIPVLPKLAELTAVDYEMLRLLGSRRGARVRDVVRLAGEDVEWRVRELVESSREPRTTISRRLQKLERLGLVTREARGRGFIYRLTTLGKMLVLKPS